MSRAFASRLIDEIAENNLTISSRFI